ncbi:hypothetical protein DC20_15375 [Rufibacter tibetensis]|uniref:Uncharacterized protein n=1 Tax=Rufibacter tibetensis TaxID=512763 RepID=A0A0P0C5A9_9BACT|nr:hypothetical protein DC20_15375 [Rufibacter tibetensis]
MGSFQKSSLKAAGIFSSSIWFSKCIPTRQIEKMVMMVQNKTKTAVNLFLNLGLLIPKLGTLDSSACLPFKKFNFLQ